MTFSYENVPCVAFEQDYLLFSSSFLTSLTKQVFEACKHKLKIYQHWTVYFIWACFVLFYPIFLKFKIVV